MPFAAGLRQSLYVRDCQLASEFTRGDTLEDVLGRHLLAVEEMAEGELVTSILLLSPDGSRLFHGAGPSLPQAYRDAIDGSEVGPAAGSCGTAAYLGRPIYVTDIATDSLWADYRHYALEHGLRSCWSTPIRDTGGSVIGTFAIYHKSVSGPTSDELEAIDMIADHVAQAIMKARGRWAQPRQAPRLRLVTERSPADTQFDPLARLAAKIERLETIVAHFENPAIEQQSEDSRAEMRALAENSRKLADVVRNHIERLRKLTP
jgi:GAF domain-containing protein